MFVCEDGADQSLVAAAYFNKLAAERGLAALASFRGVDPENHLSMRAVDGLKADGVPIPLRLPGDLCPDRRGRSHAHRRDWRHVPAIAAGSGKTASWDDVPTDRGYRTMRDVIVRHVLTLLDRLR